MKRYKRFMDGVRASDTLNQRLRALKEPKKKPAWTKYGAMAAALVLVCGLGWYGLDYWQGMNRQRFLERAQVYHTEGVPAQPEPDESMEPAATKFAGRYEVARDGMTASYLLPYIEYGNTGLSEVQTALDWDIPQGAFRRDMSREHIAYLLGGEDALSTHLDWDGYELSGWAAWYENGDFWGAYVMGHQGPLDHFEFAVTADQLPPTCIAYPHSVEQNICGVMVTADGHDSVATPSGGVDASTRRVSFMREGYGFRFDLTSTSRALAEERVSRLVRLVADGGTRGLEWATDSMGPVTVVNEDGTLTCQICGEIFLEGTVHTEPGLNLPGSSVGLSIFCPRCDQTFSSYDSFHAHVHSFPGVGGPNWDDGAPAVSAQPSNTCPDCGVTYLAGEAHYHTQTCEICGRDYPVGSAHGHPFLDGYTETCPDCGESYAAGTAHSHTCQTCGESYAAGTAHSHGTCGLPLAPDTHACEVCGQIVPAGMEHSHRQEGHHGGHH
ncbi:MAG: hypothetical protein HFF29_11470 [Oscillospiraceae bacterium]|nr:hypothetical protein [Oscillospiraceae bacterium]